MTAGRMGGVKHRKAGWQEMEQQPEAALTDVGVYMYIIFGPLFVCFV